MKHTDNNKTRTKRKRNSGSRSEDKQTIGKIDIWIKRQKEKDKR